jgi:hypothetical protein
LSAQCHDPSRQLIVQHEIFLDCDIHTQNIRHRDSPSRRFSVWKDLRLKGFPPARRISDLPTLVDSESVRAVLGRIGLLLPDMRSRGLFRLLVTLTAAV